MRKWLGMNAPGDRCFNRRPAMSDVGVEELAEILQKHNDFMAEHYDELIEKYPGKVVAIEDGQVIAVGIDYGEVYRPLLKEERSVMPLVLKVPHPDDLADGFLI
ncbi:MAG: hypothetical protein GDA56_08940 [Hormoscilla sp. GM7CHS1pb]|nr:hypothetical protein [Hormoscilla sp. GM7CHS1pb]